MSLQRVQSEVLLTGMQAPRGYSWSRPQLEQPKRLVYKKIIKPLMEKRRRDRIAHCLNQLKTLLFDAPGQGHKPLHWSTVSTLQCTDAEALTCLRVGASWITAKKHLPNSRMDKAALLEMTVRRIQTLQLAVAEDKAFHTGYSYCASLVQAFLVSETGQQPAPFQESDSASSATRETTPWAPSELEQVSCRSEDAPGSPGLRCSERSVPPSIPNTAGPQLFWRPWST